MGQPERRLPVQLITVAASANIMARMISFFMFDFLFNKGLVTT